MAIATQRTIAVGVFDSRADAQRAVNALRAAGFSESDIGVAGRNSEDIEGATATGKGKKAAVGAASGAAAGAGVGALWGIGIAAGVLPAIGPVIAGGTLAAIAASAATGAAAAGIVGALVALGIPEDEANYYQSEFAAGRIIVTVKGANRYAHAADILNRSGTIRHQYI